MAVDEFVVARPPGRLREVVPAYTGYRQRGLDPAVHRGLPSPHLTLIFTLHEPLEIARHPDPGQSPGTYDGLIGGLHTAPALIRHGGAQSGVQLQVSPLWSRRLFGLPAGALSHVDVPAEELLGRLATEVQHRLRDAPDWPGWSDRHLTQRFRAETGLTPKAAARVIRFDAARRRLQRGGVSLAGLAATYGYYDQPHLVREFRALAGCSPTSWVAAEVGDALRKDTEH